MNPLRYGTDRSPLGRTVVVAGEGGVRAVVFGEEQVSSLAGGARVVHDRALDRLAAQILDSPDVELDLRGTSFQLEVWRKLLAIPRGETRTYAQLAAELGRPGAARAVGAACGSNRIGVLVPCHRVVRSDGSLAGYRWGLERKRALLEAEGALPAPRVDV